MSSLRRAFLGRPAAEVAPDLLGRVLVRTMRGGRRLAVRLVEVEAYEEHDPASHSFGGRRTARNDVMFGPPGHLYVYFTYGMHFCANVVTGHEGEGSAVLLRAGEPLEGLDVMSRRRGTSDPRLLCSGPARLCQALGIGRGDNGVDLLDAGPLGLEPGRRVPVARVRAGPRVGVREGGEVSWRFLVAGDPFVSRGRPGPVVRPPAIRGRGSAAPPTR